MAILQTIKYNHVKVTIDKHMDGTRNLMRPNFLFFLINLKIKIHFLTTLF
jgi:hypothetical protein